MSRRLIGIALRSPGGEWVRNPNGRRAIYPSRGKAVEDLRVIGGRWRLIAIYTHRKRSPP